ncbi:hypothetical protein GCM10023169_37390 [Georgenia halophila]|uniref:Uncharacterized protein n=1 Tax=Georgenia halophila TaxID=620889 RepID=A0ABP8LLK3_9MICO
MASTTSANAPAVRKRVFHPGSLGMLLGGVLALVGSLLPWVMTPVGSLPGLAGPGLWTLSAAFIAIAGALLPYRKIAIGHCLAAGLAVAVIAGWQLGRLVYLSAITDAWGQMLPGIGLVMVSGGAVILLRTGYRLVTARQGT